MPPKLSSLSIVKGKRGHATKATDPDTEMDLSAAVDQLERDQSIPQHVKTILSRILQKVSTVEALVEENRRQTKEIESLRKENSELRSVISSLSQSSTNSRVDSCTQADLPSGPLSVSPSFSAHQSFPLSCCESKEISRSLVISGLPESQNAPPFMQIEHDYRTVRLLLNFLGWLYVLSLSIAWENTLLELPGS